MALTLECEEALVFLELRLQGQKCRVCPKGEQSRHEWVTLLTTLSLSDGVHDAVLIFPQIRRRSPVELFHEAMLNRPQPHATSLATWPDEAPMPSMDNTVAEGSRSVKAWMACAMHSVPARVDSAY